MKVALSFPGCHRRGGVERIVYECAQFLGRRGHEVTLYANEWDKIDAPNIAHRHVSMVRNPGFLRGISYYIQASRALRGTSFDVLNTHGCVCPTGGVHWVQSIQRAWLETSARFRPPYSLKRLLQRLNPLHPLLLRLEETHFRDRRYRKIIATTPEIRGDLNRLYGVPAEDVIILPNGFSPTEFNPERRRARREAMRASLGLTPDHVALLFAANELERKGYGTLLGALQILQMPELKLIVVGRPPLSAVLEQARAMNVHHQVMACGSTPHIADYHAAADLFILPTQYEAFCLAILEALGSGIPVITTDVPGARNAIIPGINGEVVQVSAAEELAEAIRRLLEPERRAIYSAQAAKSVSQYQWPRILAQYETVLRDNATFQ
jgi:UDP-glucose:(heptosyl)LPS alpha-1,3-glucosyltransferase